MVRHNRLLNADTRNPNDDSGKLSAQDIREHGQAQDDGADERAAFLATAQGLRLESDRVPPEPAAASAPPPPAKTDMLTKASLVFV
jgi:hypothetical protein